MLVYNVVPRIDLDAYDIGYRLGLTSPGRARLGFYHWGFGVEVGGGVDTGLSSPSNFMARPVQTRTG